MLILNEFGRLLSARNPSITAFVFHLFISDSFWGRKDTPPIPLSDAHAAFDRLLYNNIRYYTTLYERHDCAMHNIHSRFLVAV